MEQKHIAQDQHIEEKRKNDAIKIKKIIQVQVISSANKASLNS